MKTAVKPAKGCLANGFTWAAPDGRLTQLSWAALKERGEALYLHDGVRWRRMRDVRDLKKYGASIRVAVAPVAADASQIDAAEMVLPAGLLTGEWVEQIERLRELAALPPAVVRASNAWASLDEDAQRVLRTLWSSSGAGLSDVNIIELYRHRRRDKDAGPDALDEGLRTRRRLQASLRSRGLRTKLTDKDAKLVLDAGALLPAGVDPVDFAQYLHMRGVFPTAVDESIGDRSLIREEALFLARFAGGGNPVRDALNAIYGLGASDTDEALAATVLLTSCSIRSDAALALVRELGLTGAPSDKLDLMAAALARSGGADAPTVAKAVAELFERDPEQCLRTYGTAGMVLARMFPDSDQEELGVIAAQLGLGAGMPMDEKSTEIVAALDPRTLDEVRGLLRASDLGQADSLLLALRATVAFGERAPEWLLAVAESPHLNEARTLARLPDVDTANRRIEQLSRSLSVPRPTAVELHKSARLAAFYRGLVDAPSRAGAVMQLLGDEDLVDVLPNATAASKKAAEMAKRLSEPDLPPDERAALEATAVWLTGYSRALKRAAGPDGSGTRPVDDPDVAALLAAARNDTNLLGLLAPNPKIAAKQAGVSARVAAGDVDAWAVAVATEQELWGSSLLQEDLAAGGVIPEDVEARRAAQEAELDLWKRYSLAFLEGDRTTLLEIGGTLRPEKTDGRSRVSVHDALFWLPGNLTNSTAPDGTRFGDWLLDESRGAGAMQGANGRMSLQLAAESWSLFGGKGAKLNDVVRARVSMDYGGHDDPTSMFFASTKVAASSAQTSATHLHYSRDMPTLLPVGRVFSAGPDGPAAGDSVVGNAVDGAAPAGFRGYFLTRDDPRGVQLGMLTDCCQHPASVGRDCAIAGQSHPASGFFVVEDADGNVVAQSWVWATAAPAADGTTSTGVIFDNIEARLGGSEDRKRVVRAIYEQAADELSARFDRVLVGAGGNDIAVHDLPLTSATMSQADIGYHGYGGDSASQRVWREGRVRPGVRVEARANGFTVTEDGSSFSFTAASVPAEIRRLDRELASLAEGSPGRTEVEKRLGVLRTLSASRTTWGAGLFTEDGPDRHVVEVRGPAGRDLALRELAAGASGIYVFRDETGREELVEITPRTANPAPRVDYASLPTDYADKSKLTEVLVAVGVPEEHAGQLVSAFSGDVRAAYTSWLNGWPPAVVESALAANPTRSSWVGNQPCPPEIRNLEDPADRVRAAHVYASVANAAQDVHAATSAVASPEALDRAEFVLALATVAQRYGGIFVGRERWAHLTTELGSGAKEVVNGRERLEAEIAALEKTEASVWDQAFKEVQASQEHVAAEGRAEHARRPAQGASGEAPVPGGPSLFDAIAQRRAALQALQALPSAAACEELAAEGFRLLGIDAASPWTAEDLDKTVADAMLLAADEVLTKRILLTGTRDGNPVARRSTPLVTGRDATILHSHVVDGTAAARGRIPVELILAGDSPLDGAALPSATRSAFADDLAGKGLHPATASLLLSTGFNDGNGCVPAAASPEIVEHAAANVQDYYEEERLVGTLKSSNTYLMNGADVVALAKASASEVQAAQDLDRTFPARGLRFMQAVRDGETADHPAEADGQTRGETADEAKRLYRQAVRHALPPREHSIDEVLALGRTLDVVRETCAAAGIAPTLGHNMPDYSFDTDLDRIRSIAAYTSGGDALEARISGGDATELAVVAPLLDRFVDLTPALARKPVSVRIRDAELPLDTLKVTVRKRGEPDRVVRVVAERDGPDDAVCTLAELRRLSRQNDVTLDVRTTLYPDKVSYHDIIIRKEGRPNLEDIADGVRSGCTIEEIAEIVQMEGTPHVDRAPGDGARFFDAEENAKILRRALLVSPSLREARRGGSADRAVAAVAGIVAADRVLGFSSRGGHRSREHRETEIRWLLDLVVTNPAALERLEASVGGVFIDDEDGFDHLVHSLAAEFGGAHAELGGLRPVPERLYA
jgi:hypothetical protein